jgi:hypothetical protein
MIMKQQANIYTMMLILSFVATLIACVFLFLEMRAYEMQRKVPADLKVPATLPSAPLSAAFTAPASLA